jgi:hypothetical protein
MPPVIEGDAVIGSRLTAALQRGVERSAKWITPILAPRDSNRPRSPRRDQRPSNAYKQSKERI